MQYSKSSIHIDLCLKVTPDLLLDQGQSSEVGTEEKQVMQTIYSILREG